MLTKTDFEECNIPNLILNLCSYYEDIERLDFLKKYYRWNKEILISRWQKEWVEKEVFSENLHKKCYNILLIPSDKLFVIWEFLKKDYLKKGCYKVSFFSSYAADEDDDDDDINLDDYYDHHHYLHHHHNDDQYFNF